jgi:hypothetical protein
MGICEELMPEERFGLTVFLSKAITLRLSVHGIKLRRRRDLEDRRRWRLHLGTRGGKDAVVVLFFPRYYIGVTNDRRVFNWDDRAG